MTINFTFVHLKEKLRMKNLVLWCSLLIAGFSAISCETEVDLLAPYKAVPVVYAIIDPAEEFHFVKITKTFLGDGNALDFAQVADSSIIPNLQATVEEVRNGGVSVRSWQLRDTIVDNKEGGTFYQDGNLVYYFRAADLATGAILKLSFEFNGSKIIAESPILSAPNITKPRGAATSISFITGDIYGTWRFEEIQVEFFGVANAVQYEVSGELVFNEVYTNGTSKEVKIPMNIAKKLKGSGSSAIPTFYKAEDFYSVVKNSVKIDANVERRELMDYTFKVAAIDQELATYLSVNEPSSGISQERPEYSNVTSSNGEAFGLFAVVSASKFVRPLSTTTQRGLSGFPDIDAYKFCGPDPLLAPEPAVYCQ